MPPRSGRLPRGRPRADAGQASEFERYWEARERVALAIPAEGAKVLIVKFNDFQCPPCRNSHMAYKPVLTKFAGRTSRAGPLRPEGLPARRRVQQQRRQHDSPVRVRGGRGRAAGADAQPRRADDRVDLREPAVADARARQAGRARSGTGDGLRRQVRLHARIGQEPTSPSASSWASAPRPPSSSTARRSMAPCRRSTSSRRSSTSSRTRSRRVMNGQADREHEPAAMIVRVPGGS